MPKKSPDNKETLGAFSVKIPISLLEKARKKSAETGIAIAFVIRKALEEWVSKP